MFARQGPTVRHRFEKSYAGFLEKLRDVEHQIVAETAADRSDALLWLTRIGPEREGDDALELLERMYRSWAERRGFHLTVVSRGDAEAVWRIDGVAPYGLLKGEDGLHRFDAKEKKTPTMVRVEVLPVAEEPKLARRDIKIERRSRHGRMEIVAAYDGVVVEAVGDAPDDAVLDWLEARVGRPPRDATDVVRRYGVEGKFAEDQATGERVGQRELLAGGLDELLRARLYM